MAAPNYGAQTICRPLQSNVPDPPSADWKLGPCPYCGRLCWETGMEKRIDKAIFPNGYTAACTNCALRRGCHQAQMDAERYACEQAQKGGGK